MKTKYLVTLLIATAISWTGCTSILNKKDLQNINYNDVWNSEILATAYLDKCYRDNMPAWNTSVGAFSDEQAGGDAIKRGSLQINAGTGSAPTDEYWKYDEIYRINILLQNLTGDPSNNKSALSIEKQKEMRAQALFLRAWQYYNMIIRYGGVPYIKVPQDRYKDNLLVSRDKTSDCVKWICDDLDEAANILVSVWPNQSDFGRITKGAAMALKGRVLMFWASEIANPTNIAQRWTDAYNACLAAKTELEGPGKRALNADFRKIWGATHTSETVLTTRYKAPSRTHNTEAAIRPLDRSQGATGAHQPCLELVLSFPMKDGKLAGASAYAPVPFDPTATDATGLFWLNRDPRFYVTIVTNGCYYPVLDNAGKLPSPQGRYFTFNGFGNGSGTHFYSQKFIQLSKLPYDAQYGDLDWIEIRYAEVLLNLAECAAETNRLQEAFNIIKDIRKRAGIEQGDGNFGLPAIAGMSQQNMVDAVMFERKIEFAFENIRFWDMRRKKMFQKPPFNNNYLQNRLYIRLIPTLPSGVSTQTFVDTEFITADEVKDKLETVRYFTYFNTTVQTLNNNLPWSVPDNCANFWPIPVKHYEQNPNIAQTKGWSLAPGQKEFDPLQ